MGILTRVETPPEQGEDLADLVQWIKDQTGDSDSAIARRIDVTPATVNNWVHRKRGTGRGPAAKNLRALAAAYAGIGISEERVFAAVGRRRPGPLEPDAKERLLALFEELTEDQQRSQEIQVRALVEDNRSGSS